MSDHSFSKEIFPNIQSKPPWHNLRPFVRVWNELYMLLYFSGARLSIPALSFHCYTRVMDCTSTCLHFGHCTHMFVWSCIYRGILSEPQCKRRNVSLENAEFLSLALGGNHTHRFARRSAQAAAGAVAPVWSCSLLCSAGVLLLCVRVCAGMYVHR